MKLLKYTEGWTRRHFLEQTAKGIMAAGVIAPLWEVIGNTGSCEAAYPPELLSIEAYTKGKLKVGPELNASNVDVVKDILDPAAYWSIKNDGRVAMLGPTVTQLDHLTPKAFLEATLHNRGKHKIFPDGNVYTLDHKPWVGGNPFPEPKTPQECMMSNTLSWGKHDSFMGACEDHETDADGNEQYSYQWFYVEYQTVGRLVNSPKPYAPGHEHQLRYFPLFLSAPEDQRGTSFLQIWAYDQRLFPAFYGYTPLLKRTRTFPTDQRFEPQMPGWTSFASESWMAGDPLLTWGDFKIVGKGPLLTSVSHCSRLDRPNWELETCGGKTGKKYYKGTYSLVPECYITEMSPTHYPRSPYSKKRIWYDARTLNPLTMITYDRQGKPWQQWEGGFDYYQRKPGYEWTDGLADNFWEWVFVHAFDMQSGRMERFQVHREIFGGFKTGLNNPAFFEEYCSMDALRRLGR
jgi:hypothetical protein